MNWFSKNTELAIVLFLGTIVVIYQYGDDIVAAADCGKRLSMQASEAEFVRQAAPMPTETAPAFVESPCSIAAFNSTYSIVRPEFSRHGEQTSCNKPGAVLPYPRGACR